MSAYAELSVSTCFSFLRGASTPHELAVAATVLGHTAIAVTDRNSLAGVVQAFVALRDLDIPPERRPKLLIGARPS